MERTRRTRIIPMFVGLALVLIGLLAGILVMLIFFNNQPAPFQTPQVVERVELGHKTTAPRTAVPDSADPTLDVGLLALNGLFKEVAGRVTPAVVYIQVEVRGEDGNWFHNFDSRFRERAPRQSVGSGVIISDKGYIVTNNHVVDQADEILVTLTDKRQVSAQIVGLDPNTDLAVIKIDNEGDLPVMLLGNSDEVQVGEWVLAIGNPFRLTSTVTAGIISALGRQVNIISDSFGIEDFIQTDAAINPGNSGGALVNLHGELVGINTAIATESGSYEGYGFAVPVNLVERVVSDLIAFGEVQRGYLGVEIRDIDARRAKQLGLNGVNGVFLTNVWQGGAAYKAGLRNGDVVLTIEGHTIGAPNELQSVIARYRPGEKLGVMIWRDGLERLFEVELFGRDDPDYVSWFSELNRNNQPPPREELEAAPEMPSLDIYELAGWGIGLRALAGRDLLDFDVEEGAYIAYIEHGSPAARAGLPRDAVILQAGDRQIRSIEDALNLFEAGTDLEETLLIRVKRRDGLTAFFDIEVPPMR